MQPIVTSDLSEFGSRELGMAGKLLTAYANNPHAIDMGDRISLFMNRYSGNVFLADEDGNVAMMNGASLENFFSCPECGHEGFLEDMGPDGGHDASDAECYRYMKSIDIALPPSEENEDAE